MSHGKTLKIKLFLQNALYGLMDVKHAKLIQRPKKKLAKITYVQMQLRESNQDAKNILRNENQKYKEYFIF